MEVLLRALIDLRTQHARIIAHWRSTNFNYQHIVFISYIHCYTNPLSFGFIEIVSVAFRAQERDVFGHHHVHVTTCRHTETCRSQYTEGQALDFQSNHIELYFFYSSTYLLYFTKFVQADGDPSLDISAISDNAGDRADSGLGTHLSMLWGQHPLPIRLCVAPG